jgi:ferredoxin
MASEENDGAAGERRAITVVRDDGPVATVQAAPGETVLEATDGTGIDLRHGCREGKCVSCTARLLEGELDYEKAPRALDERQREEGFVLLCIARPVTDCRIEVGRGVLADAFPELWRSGPETW